MLIQPIFDKLLCRLKQVSLIYKPFFDFFSAGTPKLGKQLAKTIAKTTTLQQRQISRVQSQTTFTSPVQRLCGLFCQPPPPCIKTSEGKRDLVPGLGCDPEVRVTIDSPIRRLGLTTSRRSVRIGGPDRRSPISKRSECERWDRVDRGSFKSLTIRFHLLASLTPCSRVR